MAIYRPYYGSIFFFNTVASASALIFTRDRRRDYDPRTRTTVHPGGLAVAEIKADHYYYDSDLQFKQLFCLTRDQFDDLL